MTEYVYPPSFMWGILKNGWNRYPVDKQFRDYYLPENLMECLSDLGMMLYHPRADDVAVALLYWRLAYYYERGIKS